MNTQRLTSTYYDWTHGWHGFLVFYVLIAGLNRDPSIDPGAASIGRE